MTSYMERQGEILHAMSTLAYHTGHMAILSIRGTHVNWTCVSIGDHEFNIDNDDEVQRLVDWAGAVRHREPNTMPEPAPKEG